jgi:hypothetical protein
MGVVEAPNAKVAQIMIKVIGNPGVFSSKYSIIFAAETITWCPD